MSYMFQAGSVEGQVVEMGLTTTSLLNAEKFPVLVPNSLFSSQVSLSVNKSEASTRKHLFDLFLLCIITVETVRNGPEVELTYIYTGDCEQVTSSVACYSIQDPTADR